jgi:hypothetical protein
MRRLALAIVLACALSGGARAGEIHTTGAVAPPTPSTVTAAGEIPTTGSPCTVTIAGEIHSTGATAPQDSTTVLTIILALLGIVP